MTQIACLFIYCLFPALESEPNEKEDFFGSITYSHARIVLET